MLKDKKSSGESKTGSNGAGYDFDDDAITFASKLSEKLKAKVQLSANNKGKGKLVINFDSEKELNEIIEKIG